MDGDVVGMASSEIAQLDTESSEEHLSEPLYYKFTSVLQKSSVLDTLLDKKKPLPVLKKHQPLKLYRCDQCDFTFNTKASVIQHKYYKHSSDPQPFKCQLCDFKSVYRHNLKRHLSAVHDSKDPNREPTLKKHVTEVKKAKVTDHEPPRASNDSVPSEYVQVPETDFSSNKKTYSNGPKCTKTPSADSQTYKCNLCHFSSIYPHNLKRHVSMVHEGKGTDHGSAVRPKKPQPTKIPPLELEETNSEEMSVMKCEHCDFATPVKLILKKHKLIHFSSSSCQCDQPHSDDHVLPCHLCAFVSVCRKSLEIHQSLHSVFYKCDMCPYTTIHKSRLDFHEIKHSPQKLEYHREPSADSRNLNTSFIELLPVALPIHDDCETSVSRKSEIETFTEILETVDKSPLSLNVENPLMDSQESLSSEPAILPGEPVVNFLESLPSISDIDGTNSQNCDLEGIATTKATVGNCATIYSCGKCSYSTTHFVRFTAHESKHSTTSGEGVGCAKIYSCDHCSYTTKNIANFTTHEFNHSGIKPYKCELCQFSTVRKESLKRHYLIHNGEKPFKCDFCESSFRQKIHLQNHTRKLHASEVSRSPDKTASVKITPPIVIKKEMIEVTSTEADGELSETLAVSQPTINVPQTTNDLLYQSLLSMEEDELSLPPGDAVSPSIVCSQTEDNPVTFVGERDGDSFQTTQEDIESSPKIPCGSVELNSQNSNSEHVDMSIDRGTIPTEGLYDSSIEERHPNELLSDQSNSSNCLETESNSKQTPKNTDPLPTQSVGESNTLDNETVSLRDKDHSDPVHNHREDVDSSKVHALSTNSMAGHQDHDLISLSPETRNLSDNTPDATSPFITPVPYEDQQNDGLKQRTVNVSRLCKRKTTRFKRSPIKTRAYEQPKPRSQHKTPVTKSYLTERVSVNDSVVLEVVDDPSKSDSALNHKTSETELNMETFLDRNCVGDSIKDTNVHEVVLEPELKLGNGEAVPKSNNTHSQNSLVDESKGTNSKRVKHDRLVIHKLRPRRHSSSLYKRQRNVQNIKPRGRRSASATAVALSSIRDGSDLLEVKPCSVRVSRLFPWQISNPLLCKLKIRKELGNASFSKKERMVPS